MKKSNLFIFTISVLAVSSLLGACTTGYTVISQLHSDGSMTKTVYAEADSACLAGDLSKHPFLFVPDGNWSTGKTDSVMRFDFIGDSFVHNYYATRKYSTPAQTVEKPSSAEAALLPYTNGKEDWSVRKGLFFRKYTYKCTFPDISKDMPLPLEDYLTQEELKIWLQSGTIAEQYPYMTGLELYTQLYDINTKFVDWHKDCAVEVAYNIIIADTGDTLTTEQKAELFKQMRDKIQNDGSILIDEVPMDEVAKIMAEISADQELLTALAEHGEKWEREYSEAEDRYYAPFCYVFRHIVETPGHLTHANTSIREGENPVWKVDGYRLLCSDVILTAESRQANPWGFALVGGILILSIILLAVLKK